MDLDYQRTGCIIRIHFGKQLINVDLTKRCSSVLTNTDVHYETYLTQKLFFFS